MSQSNPASPELQGKPGSTDLLRVTLEDEGLEVETTEVCRVCGTGPDQRVSICSRDERGWYMVHAGCLSELVDLPSRADP